MTTKKRAMRKRLNEEEGNQEMLKKSKGTEKRNAEDSVNDMKNWQRIRNNPSLLQTFLVREKVTDAIRAYFKGQGFHEVETPLMVKNPGMEPYLEVFETTLMDHNGEEHRAFLTTSPEYSMKKLLVAGMPRIFQICKAFRNGEDLRSSNHNPEFSILEWYRTESDYFDLMRNCEELLCFIYDSVLGKPEDGKRVLKYQGQEMDLNGPWERITVAEAYLKYAGVDTDTLLDEEKLKRVGKEKGYSVDEKTTWEQVYNQIFLNEIEPHFGVKRPTILYDYPASQAALSRKKKDDPRFAERMEFYIFGKELGNGFSELTDGDEQKERLKMEKEERRSLGKVMYDLDEDFIEALKTGMPEAAGIAVGVDRLVMLFANAKSIKDVTFFPSNELFD